ncbi:hypothetical protein LVDJXP189_470006 [Flavobacterium psychrophilum]|uniref:hypothetical protein n=1 Tax=Flavobacterium psychrophilum TaxID=96345 RepID=UPI000B7C482F|nr:hypothetical protein [Flavobacterium psychrophilum]SNB43563.1 hypothetical protein LVDJXP189_470006 [Flavobacterium psychrophilum]
MNKLNFNQSVGFPIETEILDEMQNAWSLLNYLGALAGNFTIISGIDINNGNATNGFVYINGEVLNFVGGAVSTDVIINETITSLEFEDGNENPVVYIRYATFGIGATSFPWTNFKRPKTTIELTEKTQAIQTKLDDIQDGAEVNVQADWNETDNTKKSYIKNKPSLFNVLAKGTALLGDIETTDQIKTVVFPTIETSNYMVIGSVVSKQSDGNDGGIFVQGWTRDNDISYVIVNKTASNFQLAFREYSGVLQKLEFDYLIIAL